MAIRVPASQTASRLVLSNSACLTRVPRACIISQLLPARGFTTPEAIPLRKHLKDEAKRRKAEARASQTHAQKAAEGYGPRQNWELTVGIEIHAELNTAYKLFSPSHSLSSDNNAFPNSLVAPFDAALPGSQPSFQTATILPALRAALALGCQIERTSAWDRKHYFHWDQPNGYQITQYYRPFAKDGQLCLTAEDGVPATDLQGSDRVCVGIKQIQMEQDTAKTIAHGTSVLHIDLNRAGHPLIEIITLPQIHSPQTAAAFVRKTQAILKGVGACVVGMELGGLRADVNVSVRPRGASGTGVSYSGISGLGQRTEIKNLSSFMAVEKAIIAERDRQIRLLEAGGVVEGETRGWTLGATETTRLRGKEGEVDYRYMPDADLPPLIIGDDLIQHLRTTLPELPEATTRRVQRQYGLSSKDARTIVSLDDGDRLEFLEETVSLLCQSVKPRTEAETLALSRLAGNWVLHELGGLLTTSGIDWIDVNISPFELSELLENLYRKELTGRAAKQLLATLHKLPPGVIRSTVNQLIDDGNLRLIPLSDDDYEALATRIIAMNPDMAAAVRQKGETGKIMWFVGQMVRCGENGTIEPQKAKAVIERLLRL